LCDVLICGCFGDINDDDDDEDDDDDTLCPDKKLSPRTSP